MALPREGSRPEYIHQFSRPPPDKPGANVPGQLGIVVWTNGQEGTLH